MELTYAQSFTAGIAIAYDTLSDAIIKYIWGLTLPYYSDILVSVMAKNNLTIKEAETAIAVLREETKTFDRYAAPVAAYKAALAEFKIKEAEYKAETNGGNLSEATEPIDTKRVELFYDIKAIDRDEVALNESVAGFYKDCLHLWRSNTPADPREKKGGRQPNLTDWDEAGLMEKHLLTGWKTGLKSLSGYADLNAVKKAALEATSDDDLLASIPNYRGEYKVKGGATKKSRSPRQRTQDGGNYLFNQMNNVMHAKGQLVRKNINEGKTDTSGNKLRGAKFEYKLA
ncbi:hypothetical protein CMI37_25110 [Candidatus Pacearchaeota archaeon]|nr:hypothetical protein [Candidatus Pacearchaeota archaeon]